MNASNMFTSKLDKHKVLDTVFKLDWQESEDKEYMVVKMISMFRTAVHFFPTCQALKAWLELYLYRNGLKGNKKLLRVSGRFELSRVKL